VRAARESDRDELVPLIEAADVLHARLSPRFFLPPARAELATRARLLLRQAVASDDQVILVAEDRRRRVCGMGHARVYDTPPRADFVPARRAHVESLVVAPDQRRSGCGRRLIGACQEWARRKGATELVLTVWEGNREAERFYAALGFRPVSHVLGTAL
jgi:ribosomal protein S18 acetylase RimI-like enzyme